MRLAISNIAWDIAEDEAVAGVLQRHRVDAIDVAPGKYFPQPVETTDAEISRIKDWWGDRGIEITGMEGKVATTQILPGDDDTATLWHRYEPCRRIGPIPVTIAEVVGRRGVQQVGKAVICQRADPFSEGQSP